MDVFEKSARKRHGQMMYDLTWKARKGNNKWLWGLVALLATLQLIWRPVLFAVIAYIAVSASEGFWFKENMKFGLTFTVLIAAIGAPIFEAAFLRSWAFAHTSNFISVAGDMNRVSSSAHSRLGRLVAKVGYLAAGALALYCALAVYWFSRKRLHTLSVTELDVLGNALSKGGFWRAAEKIFDVLHAHFSSESLCVGSEARQVAVSYALACKWMMRKPDMDKAEKEYLRAIIYHVMEKYKLPEEVTMRLKEALV